jgi:ankyrin repeat protein
MEGQTPLHYATVCEREDIAKYLIDNGADASVKDNDGTEPYSLCPSYWNWMSGKA